MPKAGDIKYCDLLGGRKTNAAFVYVPPSAFWMGDDTAEENPVHLVGVSKGFWIQQTELTEEQYQYLNNIYTSGSPRSKKPKTKISWEDVSNLVSKKPLRLPTAAEWELAAKAGVNHKYLWAGSNGVGNVAWTAENSYAQIQPVANLKSNSFGLYDSSGNIHEWCSDWHSDLISAPQFDPQGPASGLYRNLRGGSSHNNTQNAWIANRHYNTPNHRNSVLGVRLIWEI